MSKVKLFVLRSLLVTGTIALVTSLGFTGILYAGRKALDRQNQQQESELHALRNNVDRLRTEKGNDETQLIQLKEELAGMAPDNLKMKNSIGAFALQAASCDTLKKTLNIKDDGV